MGRLTPMPENSRRRCTVGVALCGALVLSSCSIESPVTVSSRPLAEQLDDRDRASAGIDETDRSTTGVAPETLAFSEAMASGDFIRLHVTDEGIAAGLRSGPGSSYDLISDVPGGTEVYGTGNQTGEWVHVLYADFEGWVRMRRVSLVSTASQDRFIEAADVDRAAVTYVVAGEAIGVNIRAEPDEASDLVSGAPVGSRVVGTGHTEGIWIEITFDGVTGWASGNYLEPVGLEPAVPEPEIVEPIGTQTE